MSAPITRISMLVAVGLLCVGATDSLAATRNFHPTACWAGTVTGLPSTTVNPLVLASGSGQFANPVSGNNAVLFCPLITDSQVTLPAPGISDPVTVSLFYNGKTGVGTQTSARACRVFAGGGGAGQFCSGVSVPTNGAGVYQLPVQVLSGGSAADYYYLLITLGLANNGSVNTLFGYSITN